MELWSPDGPLQDGQLVAQGHVLEGEGRRPEGHGANECPQAKQEDHRDSRESA